MSANRHTGSKSIPAHRDALAALARRLGEPQSGGLLGAALESLNAALRTSGGVAYRVEGRELVLSSECQLPRKAKPWLARLPLDDEPWFVAQRVARSATAEISPDLAGARDGHSVAPILEAAGWTLVAAVPVMLGRQVAAVLVLAAPTAEPFDNDGRALLDTAAQLLSLGMLRQQELERRREDRLREAKTAQLATIGLLASTVGGELDAPLGRLELCVSDLQALLAGLGSRLKERPPELNELIDLGGDLATGLRATRAVTKRLLAYSEESRLESLDLGELVKAAAELMRDSLDTRGIALEVNVGPRPVRVVGRREGLQLLVAQLLLHAAQECERHRTGSPRIELGVSAQPTGSVLSVETTARGSAPRLGARAFEAFLTGKRGVETASLGLALARQMVLAHNGHIELGASANGRSLIRVVFPVSPEASRRQRDFGCRPSTEPSAADGQPPSVVWIDDDEPFVRALRRCLPRHAVHGARTINDAKELLKRLPEPPEMVFCDVGLEDGRAVELHRSLGDALKERFVFVTAGVIPAEIATYLITSGRPTLIKPIAMEEVIALLALDPAAQATSPSVAPTLHEGSSRPPAPSSKRPAKVRDKSLKSTLPEVGLVSKPKR